MSKKETLQHAMEHADKFGEARIAGGVGMLTAYGMTLEQWIGIATLLYLVLQIGLLIPKYFTLWRARKQK